MKIFEYGHRPGAIRLFEIGICSWLVLHSTKLIGIRHFMLGVNSIGPAYQSPFLFDMDRFIAYFGKPSLLIAAIGIQIVLCMMIIWKSSSFVSRLGIWFLTINIFATCPAIEDGGTALLKILLLLYIFIQPGGTEEKEPMAKLFQSVLIFLMQLQIAMVYLQAALSKITAAGWSTGVALHYILQMPEFTDHFLAPMMLRSDFLLVAGAYATILFQLSFPFWIWFRKARWCLLAIGVCFHLTIALAMNLLSFGILMIILYAIFLDDEDIELIKRGIRGLKLYAT